MTGYDDRGHSGLLREVMAEGTPLPSPSEPVARQNPDPGDAFRRAFPKAVKESIVAAVKKAYEFARESHDESVGFNAQTFGYIVYHLGRFQLERLCKESDGRLERVEDMGALFRFQNGHYRLGFYKVGRNASEDIWEALPSSDNGGVSGDMGEQLFLDGLDLELSERVDQQRYVVVAHLGNPDGGLGAVYLCIPGRVELGKITRWGYVEPLFVATEAPPTTVRASATGATSRPLEEPEQEVLVRPRAEPVRHDRSR